MIVLKVLEILLYLCFSVNILYLLVFSIASVRKRRKNGEKEPVSFRRIVILIPAYKEDRVLWNA